MTATQPESSPGLDRRYWTHKVDAFPSPVAQFRMAQLIDLDERLYENARIVYRFLVGWYHDGHGDALLSQRHVAKVMKQRAPEAAAILSNRTVGRAIITLMETGWVARTFNRPCPTTLLNAYKKVSAAGPIATRKAHPPRTGAGPQREIPQVFRSGSAGIAGSPAFPSSANRP